MTINFNELEKHEVNKEHDKVKEAEARLANGFLLLGDYMKCDFVTRRECVLSAFSVDPTQDSFERVKELARASGKLEEVDCDSQVKCEIAVSPPVDIPDEQKVNVPQAICDDLYTLVCRARYLVLSWYLDWSELSSRCETYIASSKEIKNTEKELKYLKIDYSIYENSPQSCGFGSARVEKKCDELKVEEFVNLNDFKFS